MFTFLLKNSFLLSIICVVNSLSYNSNIIDKFKTWTNNFKVNFVNEHHLIHVFENWLSNDKFIEESNQKNLTYKLAHNVYSGLNSSEFNSFMNFKSNKKLINQTFLRGQADFINNIVINEDLINTLPLSVDWRLKDVVTDVKNQGQCGSCWSFSTTGALEGAYSIKYGKLISFSEQQLVDCSNIRNGGSNLGCNGGEMQTTLDWIGKYGGLCTEEAYPYVSGTTLKANTCDNSCSKIIESTVKSTVSVLVNSDSAMMTALSQQPVSIAIQADQKEFQLYSSGVFTATCGTDLDHGVLLVGYGTDNNQDYYIMKNSWGSSWGENGYMRMGRGNIYNDGKGQCGLLMEGAYPIL